ncbi:N-acetyltransferase [Sphingobacterium psychroaquaticum]|uniref:GNAT family N-acetyltransferase n=1 Tax=Sphingobacterium psychroaquaticum TaxID=561061 RepID=UPI0010696740|nr:GNAT family N-acetyltransferase [Sphingobacterium psychroaquaticum]QBQ41049.1 N-acetyltransferase [Sphingobacterium psychroaquaticum]
MDFNKQPTLTGNKVVLEPLLADDFESLYAVASDPLIWEQHPNKDRWQASVFRNFFTGALASNGAFKVLDKDSGAVLGSSRFYNYDEETDSIFIGYTFYGLKSWGKGINQEVKTLMLNYAFRFVSAVYFHVGAENKRSQIAMERLSAKKIKEEVVAYFGEASRLNFVYQIEKEDWENRPM